MCDKCVRRAIGLEIVNMESKLSSFFKKVEANPKDYKNDTEFIRLLECMSDLLEKYQKMEA